MSDFIEFRKIPRLFREMVITEKIDGTNAQVCIDEDGALLIGSRNRWITPESDNYGFARWATEHVDELRQLGPGNHYGEWWGPGIQRRYGVAEKRFSLFNVHKWWESRPACCHVVPTLYYGPFDLEKVKEVKEALRVGGSQASPGFMLPEGVVVFHTAANLYFKSTIDKDDEPKGRPQ